MIENITPARYDYPPLEYIEHKRALFKAQISLFASYHGIPLREIRSSSEIIDDITTRVNQRENYYTFFHGKRLAQNRQAATKAFWILKYRPLSSLLWNRSHEYDINIYFAFFILFSESLGQVNTISAKAQHKIISSILTNHEEAFLRGLSEYDISKEALMLISDSIENIIKCEIKNHHASP